MNAASTSISAAALGPWWTEVWLRHARSYEAISTLEPADEEGLRKELIFCLLGGHGVTYELASSATSTVMMLRPFADEWSEDELRSELEDALASPQFEPRRADGALRRYRFPIRKARLIASAVTWVQQHGALSNELQRLPTEAERRAWLCLCPGVGMKTASWLLRNCGWARRLAIVDVHVLRALTEAQIISDSARLPRDYASVEEAYLSWADDLGACPAALDLFLWDVQRTIPQASGGNRQQRPVSVASV